MVLLILESRISVLAAAERALAGIHIHHGKAHLLLRLSSQKIGKTEKHAEEHSALVGTG
jgi:hypothetical protein